jgi:L-lactate dehydrogenase complex protein LldG
MPITAKRKTDNMEASNSRRIILERAEKNKPDFSALPDFSYLENEGRGSISQFETVLKGIGGSVYRVHDINELMAMVNDKYPNGRIYSPIPEIKALINQPEGDISDGHNLNDVELAIIRGHFAVAENGAVWITDKQMVNRALPFICQHLAVVIKNDDILPTMHQAYVQIGQSNYDYGAFIAGPSKTADIEQSLVLGAHGPKSMAVFILSA